MKNIIGNEQLSDGNVVVNTIYCNYFPKLDNLLAIQKKY